MPSVGQCPHCGEEFNENDLEEAQLYRDFKKLCNQEVLKKNRRIRGFLGSPLLVVLVFFLTYWVDRYPWLLIVGIVACGSHISSAKNNEPTRGRSF